MALPPLAPPLSPIQFIPSITAPTPKTKKETYLELRSTGMTFDEALYQIHPSFRSFEFKIPSHSEASADRARVAEYIN